MLLFVEQNSFYALENRRQRIMVIPFDTDKKEWWSLSVSALVWDIYVAK
jgi:hypothetical protein